MVKKHLSKTTCQENKNLAADNYGSPNSYTNNILLIMYFIVVLLIIPFNIEQEYSLYKSFTP